jgi:hypothetical protein
LFAEFFGIVFKFDPDDVAAKRFEVLQALFHLLVGARVVAEYLAILFD